MKRQESPVKRIFRFAYAINFISQTAFSMLCPAGLCIGLGWLLTRWLHAGRWLLAAAIILGVLTGFYSMIYFIVKYGRTVDPTEQISGRRTGSEREGTDR